ncbi:uncharacterized protein C8R40DRAFT_1267827 [Lentinula edodes]|uniref:uncharacterized protein n=1 Tax=Lentinula edodes TaxID=5353 RepID=UPI001E8E5615|nr:uncharacterized protein C8R40DRAFT_1267827 [Lentinula edodes]KAH7870966.1 hypothetical protein C8R40DRAFT_1267827 [Lentinula edodes]
MATGTGQLDFGPPAINISMPTKDPIVLCYHCLFGVTGHQGNYGEDIKELYYYHDSTPSHSYMRFLYKYPQRRYLYKELVTKNQNRSRDIAEYEILDSDAFDEDRYWDVFMEPLMPSLTAHNRSGIDYITAKHPDQPKTHLYCPPSLPPVGPDGNFDVDPETETVEPELLFTENNTNFSRLYRGSGTMKPDGQLPAYKWNFGDVNPPVHAWATFRVFKIERKLYDREDLEFLERVFQKLLLNFTWWETCVKPDGTAWMAFYCLNMLNIALELAKHNHVYEAFSAGDNESSLWNEEDGMYYDAISFGPGNTMQLPVRSLVGLIPLYATMVLEPSVLKCLPGFKKRMEWFIDNRPGVPDRNIANMKVGGRDQRRLLVLASKERLVSLAEDA